MKIDNETLHQLALTRDVDGLSRACAGLKRELETKNDLINRYTSELDRLTLSGRRLAEKLEVVESERNLLRRVCRRLEVVCDQKNIKEEYEAAWQEYDLSSSES